MTGMTRLPTKDEHQKAIEIKDWLLDRIGEIAAKLAEELPENYRVKLFIDKKDDYIHSDCEVWARLIVHGDAE